MDGKTKVVIIAVIGMLVVGIGLSAASCAVRSATQGDAPVLDQAESPEKEEGESSGDAEGEAEPGAELTAYERACIISWSSENGATLQLSKGMITERDANGAIHAMTLSSVAETPAGSQTLITAVGIDESAAAEATWTLILDEGPSAPRISSDDFNSAPFYVKTADYGRIEVTGVDEGLLSLVGGDRTPLVSTLEDFVERELPQASTVDFDGEAFIDFNEGTVSATFHADDPERTVVTLTYKDGAFAASK